MSDDLSTKQFNRFKNKLPGIRKIKLHFIDRIVVFCISEILFYLYILILSYNAMFKWADSILVIHLEVDEFKWNPSGNFAADKEIIYKIMIRTVVIQ